jgi:hypothetical protein
MDSNNDLSSFVDVSPARIGILHASLTDFLVDPMRLKEFWFNRQARHSVCSRSLVFSVASIERINEKPCRKDTGSVRIQGGSVFPTFENLCGSRFVWKSGG